MTGKVIPTKKWLVRTLLKLGYEVMQYFQGKQNTEERNFLKIAKSLKRGGGES